MRQLGSGSHLENTKSYKSIDRDTTIGNISRIAVSQSAPHTPVSAPNHTDSSNLKTVPRLLSEPLVSAKNPSPGNKSLDCKSLKLEHRPSPRLEKKTESVDNSSEVMDSVKVCRAASVCVPVHSPRFKVKRNGSFNLKSPLFKKETKVQMENNGTTPDRFSAHNAAVTDGTDV